MAAASRRDELEARLERKLDQLSEAVTGLRTVLARVESAQEQAHGAASTAQLRVDALDARVTALEASKHRAEGAAWAGKLVWVGVVAAAAAASFLAHYLVPHMP